jgi:hypothetical protein
MRGVSLPASSMSRDSPFPFVGLFRPVHQQLRDEVDGLDDDALNWVPIPGANSIATIVTHLVGSEAETLRCVAGLSCERDRDGEFVACWLTSQDVLQLLERADALIAELEPRIDESRLRAEFALPTLPADDVRPGLSWLISNYGHAREHVGQIQLTKQLRHR